MHRNCDVGSRSGGHSSGLGECPAFPSLLTASIMSGVEFCLMFFCSIVLDRVVFPFRLQYSALGLPRWFSTQEPGCQCRRHRRCRFNPWVRKTPWRRKWQPTPGFFPGESHGQRNLVGYSPWGLKGSDRTERLHFSLSINL